MRKINHRFNHLSKWLFAGAVTIIALLTVFIGGPSNASAAPFNLNNMRWGLLPAGDPTTPDGPATYSLMRTPALDARDWNPSPDYNPGNLESFGTTAGNTASLQNPYVVGTSSPKVVAMDKDNYNQSDAQVGDTITQYDSSKFLVTGVSLGANSDMMLAADPTYDGSHTAYRLSVTTLISELRKLTETVTSFQIAACMYLIIKAINIQPSWALTKWLTLMTLRKLPLRH
ncbi:hypothetical protein G8J22_00568 [Lentilactobacillus hilgardii]|uniref:hypothetical protein n=1 Tax=Lentilactobacillus hilgardii TaxID=1588 RepID=UPI00019C4762|nr:hypothetical protein [Lentilactobacillus hilgardii]EEI20371.1 hypothetical protein HMPREF0497_0861 [Lentilactobacillus buchneri ATCC 11577]MCT3395822.1 hypothetical protein [Lentilactobacillus hilgardii]QIR08634.1 hypothetical protein G8J22_00568 [Lentilactobacillus hilgardii]